MGMWNLYLTAKGTHSRPSELVGVTDKWAALQLDSAVVLLGTVLQNAAEQRVKSGDEWVNRYRMKDLLTPGFVIGGDDEGDAFPASAEGLIVDEVS